MFGSLRLEDRLLKQEERAEYRAHFCGTCHALRAFGGRPCSILTNYDETVLTLVAAGLDPDPRPVAQAACTALPWRKVPVAALTPETARFVAAATVVAIGAKLRDDVDDDRKLGARIGLRLLSAREARAREALDDSGFDVQVFDELPAAQALVERATDPMLAELAAPSAAAGGEVFAHAARVCGRPDAEASLRRFGAALTEFVYVWDAVIDRDEDRRRGRFNALDRARDGAAAGRVLDSALTRCESAFAEFELSAGPRVLVERLLESLRRKLDRHLAWRDTRASQAGDCDVCACAECGACECGACSDSACGCEVCFAPCDCCCYGGSERRERRRRKRGG